jgi:hypothetical protein
MWAFSDESERGQRMLLAVVFVPSGALDGARAELRKLLLPGQRRIHTSDESSRRRRLLLDAVAGPHCPAYDHRPARTEPLLWAADAVCWAVGAGPEWQRRLRGAVELHNVP